MMLFKHEKWKSEEEGFTLTEMIVSLVIISGAVTAFIGLLVTSIDNQVLSESRDQAQGIAQNIIAKSDATPFLNLGFTEAEYKKSVEQGGFGKNLTEERFKLHNEYLRVLPAGVPNKSSIVHKSKQTIGKQEFNIETYFVELQHSKTNQVNNVIDDKSVAIRTTVIVTWKQNNKDHEVSLSKIRAPRADECISQRLLTVTTNIPAQCKLYKFTG